MKNGDDFTGFDIEVMDAVAQRLGVEVEYVATPWDSMFAALGAGRFDIVANQVTSNPERKQLYDLSDPYVETGGVLVVAEDNPQDIQSLEDLEFMAMYGLAAVYFWIICMVVSFAQDRAEERFSRHVAH